MRKEQSVRSFKDDHIAKIEDIAFLKISFLKLKIDLKKNFRTPFMYNDVKREKNIN